MGPAGVLDCNAEAVVVEDPAFRAAEAGPGRPVPLPAASFGFLQVILDEEAASIDQTIADIASQTESILVMSAAGVTYRDTLVFAVENPANRALYTGSFAPGPAAKVSHESRIRWRDDAAAI